jgi:FAD dependent oxidoreductase
VADFPTNIKLLLALSLHWIPSGLARLLCSLLLRQHGLLNFSMQLNVFLIVGSGVFGASTTYRLVKTLRKCRVILIEKSSWAKQCGASIDVNKIIRVEYEDPVYLRLCKRTSTETSPLVARGAATTSNHQPILSWDRAGTD